MLNLHDLFGGVRSFLVDHAPGRWSAWHGLKMIILLECILILIMALIGLPMP